MVSSRSVALAFFLSIFSCSLVVRPLRAQAVPIGSYQATCKDIAVNGDTLSAWCATIAGTWDPALLVGFSQCLQPPSNLNGTLACNIGSNPPAGSYQQSCRFFWVTGSTLNGECASIDGQWIRTSLHDFSQCLQPPSNLDGTLACNIGSNPPPGSYQQSCRVFWVTGSTLSGECKNIAGQWIFSLLQNFSQCLQPPSNLDGTLACNIGSNPPAGSYQQSCRFFWVNGSTLSGECKNIAGQWIFSSLQNFSQCLQPPSNLDGTLACNIGSNPPAGSYQQSCRVFWVTGSTLNAECASVAGQWNRTSLENFSQCLQPPSNLDGTLACNIGGNPPAGSYQQSCRFFWVNGSTLSGECKNIAGQWIFSSLQNFSQCLQPPSNLDGTLACNIGSNPPAGSYQQSCRVFWVTGSTLNAECASVAGQWNRTSLENFSQCLQPPSNLDGTLACNIGSNPPAGSYQQSCRFFWVNLDTLMAECGDLAGHFVFASLPEVSQCLTDVANINGHLVCNVKLVDMIPASLSGEKNQDSEPFLSVKPGKTQLMVGSAFTPNPTSSSGKAPVYVTQDGGDTWVLNAITPVTNDTCDITHALVSGEGNSLGDLHGGMLACTTSMTGAVTTTLSESETTDVTSSTTMTTQSTRTNIDQPFVQALSINKADQIYVGLNDFSAAAGASATVDASPDGGTTFASTSLETRATASCPSASTTQDGPSIRPAISADNTVYVAFFGWRTYTGSCTTATITSDVVVVRDDGSAALISSIARDANTVTVNTVNANPFASGQTVKIVGVSDTSYHGSFTIASVSGPSQFTYSQVGGNSSSSGGSATVAAARFKALADSADGLAGRMVIHSASIPWDNASAMGQERLGSTLSIAVDPNNSFTIYVGWADRIGNGDLYTLHVRRSEDRGATWSLRDLPHTTITNATNIALAISDAGVVGLMYQQLTAGRWVTHLIQTKTSFDVVRDTILADVPADTPIASFHPYLGDYAYLMAVGNEFRGVFCANNTPDLVNFPQGVAFQRSADFSSHKLKDGSGHDVDISIDPFYFSVRVMQ